MEKLKLLNVDFGPIKTKEMKAIEKIKKLQDLRNKGIITWKQCSILTGVIANSFDEPLVMTNPEFAEMYGISLNAMCHSMKSLKQYGLRMSKLNDFRYEFTVEL